MPVYPGAQWVLSLPKRIRPFLPHDPRLAGDVLRILLRAIRTTLRRTSPPSPGDAQLGAISFLHRFGSALNRHFHFHVVVLDGVFSESDDGTGIATMVSSRPMRTCANASSPSGAKTARFRPTPTPTRAATPCPTRPALPRSNRPLPPRPTRRSAPPPAPAGRALLARIYEVFPLLCPDCGAEMRILAFITAAEPVDAILAHLGLPATPPPLSPARGPPQHDLGFDFDQTSAYVVTEPEPVPVFDFDQSAGA